MLTCFFILSSLQLPISATYFNGSTVLYYHPLYLSSILYKFSSHFTIFLYNQMIIGLLSSAVKFFFLSQITTYASSALRIQLSAVCRLSGIPRWFGFRSCRYCDWPEISPDSIQGSDRAGWAASGCFFDGREAKKGILEAARHSPKSLILCFHAGRAYAHGITAASGFQPHDTGGNSAVNNVVPGRNASRPAAPRSHPASDRHRYAAYFCFHPDSASTHRTPWRCWWPSAPAARRTA